MYGQLRLEMGDKRAAKAMLQEALEIFRKAPLPRDARRTNIEQTLAGPLAAVR
jgi:hypothetical protein